MDKTGSGQLEILSALAEEPGLRQKEIVGRTSLSKGSVSNNVRKLREKELLEGEEELGLNEERLLELYREHVEIFLARKSSEPEELNELRTHVKKNMSAIIAEDEVLKVLKSVLGSASGREDLESINSVFKEVDRVLYETAGSEAQMIGYVTDRSNSVGENPVIAEEAQRILDEVKE